MDESHHPLSLVWQVVRWPLRSILRKWSESGDKAAVDRLIAHAGEQGNIDETRRLTDQGNTSASDQYTEFASEQGNLDELRRLADQHQRKRDAGELDE